MLRVATVLLALESGYNFDTKNMAYMDGMKQNNAHEQKQKDTIELLHQLCRKWNPFEETDEFHTSQTNRRR